VICVRTCSPIFFHGILFRKSKIIIRIFYLKFLTQANFCSVMTDAINNSELANCLAAEASVSDSAYNIVRFCQLLFGTFTILLLLRIVWICIQNPAAKLHRNLIVDIFISRKLNIFSRYCLWMSWFFMPFMLAHFFLLSSETLYVWNSLNLF
jgi:hypothetical protein